MRREVLAVLGLGMMLAQSACTAAGPPTTAPAWTGEGSCRLLVEVNPVDIRQRKADVMPAELIVDLKARLNEIGIAEQRADLSSLQVIRYDPATGAPLPCEEGYLYGRGPDDRPFNWYDAAIPYEFPQILGSITRVNGELHRVPKTRAGYFYNAVGDWNAGHLAWSHTQSGHDPSYYAIYFDLLPAGQEPQQQSPRGWIGDGMPRCDRWGTSTTGNGHTLVTLDDWDGDGLADIIYGEQYGCMFVMPNRGSKQKPEFPYQKMLCDADGVPIDIGLHAAPYVTDWDGDGAKDLLVGVYENHVVFYKNVGTNRDRKLVYKKFIKADGKDLKLPIRPVLGRPEAPFDEDYYPVIERADWNGDGRLDLLAGGYITGRIFFFENTGTASDGAPLLTYRGPIEVDGKPLNVGEWCASPCIADFNGDGKLDLITGSHPMSPEAQKNYSFLRYYQNVGSTTQPVLTERPFPKQGNFPGGSLACARACDWDGDGLLDLIVGCGENIYLFRNVGTKAEPKFNVQAEPLRSAWGNATLPTRQFLDWNKDGWPDYVDGYQVHLNARVGSPYRFDEVVNSLPPGVNIAHPSGVGDDWFWPYLCDFDGDGKVDVLFGDWAGNIWFHRNTSTADKQQFDVAGYRLKMTDGQEIKVGPIKGDITKDFVALQGARTVFTVADFDGDGLNDLAVGDTYGIIRYYRNAGTKEAPVFDPPAEVGDLKIRLLLDATDWDGDGRMDIIAGVVSHMVRVFLNTGTKGHATFGPPIDPGIPPVLEPGVVMVDMNRDGDQDLFLTSTQGSVLVERSFVEHGYAPGRLIRIEKRGP